MAPPPPLPPQLPGLLQQLRQPARCLRDAGCCGLCVLRLIGAMERAGYQQQPQVVERLLDEYLLRRLILLSTDPRCSGTVCCFDC